jgi:hypothetical protein
MLLVPKSSPTLMAVKHFQERVYGRAIVVAPPSRCCAGTTTTCRTPGQTIPRCHQKGPPDGACCVAPTNASTIKPDELSAISWGGIHGSYWVGHVLTGTKLSGQIYLPSTEVHKADRRDGTVGWVCDKSWQKGTNSDVHRGRARLPKPAAGLDELNAEGGSRLCSESAAAARAAHRVTSDATDEVERLEAAAATAREEELQREAASVAAAEVAAARVEALQSQVDAMHAKLDAEQQLVVKLQRQLAAHAGTAASFSQQRTLDGKVISGIDTIAKVYEALKLKLDVDGHRFDKQYTTTRFAKDCAELTERREGVPKMVLGGRARRQRRARLGLRLGLVGLVGLSWCAHIQS